MEYIIAASVTFVVSLGLCAILNKIFIPILRRVKLGQKILEIGPAWHKCKEGTPTMGGVFFITPVIIAAAAVMCFVKFDARLLAAVVFALVNGLIGLIDDYVKLFKKQNQGLTPTQKLIFQFSSVIALLVANALLSEGSATVLQIPFVEGGVDIGIFYYIIMFIGGAYIINCANLTDGLDGLAGSVALVISVLMFILAYGEPSGFVVSAIAGGLIGFLIFNHYPAKIFMGDTGSLFLGAVMVALAMYLHIELVFLLACIVWIIEGLSVMLQVTSYKLTKKRIFKMAPIHHHFEMCGWSEIKVVLVFTLVTALGCVLAYVLNML